MFSLSSAQSRSAFSKSVHIFSCRSFQETDQLLASETIGMVLCSLATRTKDSASINLFALSAAFRRTVRVWKFSSAISDFKTSCRRLASATGPSVSLRQNKLRKLNGKWLLIEIETNKFYSPRFRINNWYRRSTTLLSLKNSGKSESNSQSNVAAPIKLFKKSSSWGKLMPDGPKNPNRES
jgi:hypothetical protein